jgi:hypothetical protein
LPGPMNRPFIPTINAETPLRRSPIFVRFIAAAIVAHLKRMCKDHNIILGC